MNAKYYRTLTLGLALSLSTSFAICNAAAADDTTNYWPAAVQTTDKAQPMTPPSGTAPTGAPPEGSTPPGPPPDGKGGPGMSQEAQSADALNASYIVDATAESSDAAAFTSETADENTILVRNGGNLTLTNAALRKTGDSSSSEDSNFTGLNAVFLANNSTAKISNTTLDSASEGSNAIFSTGKNSKITVDHVKIHTTKGSSRGLDSTYGGTITASDVEITTEGAHCAALATDRGEGTVTVTRGSFSTAGDGSPCVYSTGTIKATDSKGTASGSEIAVVEGKNSIELENTQLVGKVKHGVMLYQSFSGDAGTGTASFTAKNSKLTNLSSGPMFYITNTKAIADLENTVLESNGSTLINVTSDRWGETGRNGGDFTFRARNQQLKGDVLANNLSSISLQLEDGASWTGSLNKDNAAQKAAISLTQKAAWTLTADSYVASLEDQQTDFSNINSNGHNIYYETDQAKSLGGKTYTLNGGGKLTPAK